MKKLLSMALCLVMILSVLAVFTACGGNSSDSNSDYDNNAGQIENNDNEDQQVEEKEEVAIIEEAGKALPSKLVANKISSYNQSNILVYEGGYLYGKDNKIGISSFDGKSNSGAIYTSAKGTDKYFIVATKEVNIDVNNPASLNIFGLADASGKAIVPCEYASLKVLNDRYAWVCDVTELTTDKDNAVTYMSKDGKISLYPKDDDYFFKGTWYIFDITTGQKVEGATGTKPETPRVKSNVIYFKNDAGTEVVINHKGEAMDADAVVMDDGSYVLEGKVYKNDGSELFTLKKNGFEPYRISEDGKFYTASKYVDHESCYAVMDTTGKVVSAEFKDNIYLYGMLIECEDKVYNFKGEQVVEGEFDSIYYSTAAGIDIYFLEKDDKITVLDGAFNVIFTGDMTDEIKEYKSYGVVTKTVDKVNTCYNYTAKDYTVDGYATNFLMALGGKYPTYNLNEVISGSTLISNVKSVDVEIVDETIYVIALTDTAYDIYTIVAG